jgi:hypothetical protein
LAAAKISLSLLTIAPVSLYTGIAIAALSSRSDSSFTVNAPIQHDEHEGEDGDQCAPQDERAQIEPV